MPMPRRAMTAYEQRQIREQDLAYRAAHAPGPDLPTCAVCHRPLAQSWGYGAYRGSPGLSACFEHRGEVEAMVAQQKVRAA